MKTRKFLQSAFLAAAALATAVPATAQTNRKCAPHASVVETLSKKYGEARRSIGLDSRGALVEVFVSTASGTWTIIATSPQGVTCLIASGQSFETLTEALPAKGHDA